MCVRWVKKCAVARNSGPVVPLRGTRRDLLLGQCPAARYARLPGTMPDCPAARNYARLSGCPVCPAVRLPGNMPNCPELCPECPASPASALRPRLDAQRQLSAAPLATSTDRHERRCATTPQDRAQLRGRASGVRCKAMLGRSDRKKRWNDARNMQLFLCHKSL